MTTTTAADGRLTRRQAELLDQLEALFLAEGFARFTLDDLAVRLRCSKSTLYALADSKEQLAVRVVRHFFRKATEAVEAGTATEEDPALRVTAYLSAVARALAPAGPRFRSDLDAFPPGRSVYERNTALAADRVRELIAEGVARGRFREVHPALVADTVTTLMLRIGRGDTAQATGLDDATAYRELAALLLHGISL
ncbi:TetR/AcrR family transcriptional regulator [Geodermatophilus marinus]|uniref:TetR/AcrR family transcriptional regulator n=1 Tax=Geodermatophilus sp. LHW52908 TaxID=2303986 RepID=UPI000E3E1D98|nr:TetR/AcrR family transcriptional regulator [Geodermatophilus sp. LHW52908]RFU21064.1 TetR/AcrR family transcriptional regulator [Geodermatophilus sp. LHW52908]